MLKNRIKKVTMKDQKGKTNEFEEFVTARDPCST